MDHPRARQGRPRRLPWLVRKFVDKEAEFLFVPADQVMAVAERVGAIPYDVKGVELGHHGQECSFDALVRKYSLKRPGLGIARQDRQWGGYR